MKIVSGILRALSFVVYAVIIAALAIAAPLVTGNRPVVVLSGSMEPAYPVGSIIYYKQADFTDIQVGDAITFRIGENSLATHRVVEKNDAEQTFVTKGDNNPSVDGEPVAYSNVVGKATTFAVPYAGFLTKYIQNWIAIGLMGMILLLDMLVGSRGKKDTEETPVSER